MIFLMYSVGQGIEVNETRAIFWLKSAAQKGLPKAQKTLGLVYLRGLGVNKDMAEAQRWFGYAAEQGDNEAQTYLDQLNRTDQGTK